MILADCHLYKLFQFDFLTSVSMNTSQKTTSNSAQTAISFMRFRRIAQVFSIVLILASVGSLIGKGLNLGLDFTGGTLVEMQFTPAAKIIEVREKLESLGFEDAQIVHYGSEQDVLVRLPKKMLVTDSLIALYETETTLKYDDVNPGIGDVVYVALQSVMSNSDIVLKRIEFVGPQVGEELREQGGLGLLIAILCVMVYVAVQFQIKFSLGAVVALLHDVLITLGIFSLLQLDFDLTVLAALLAVIGYSLNDTIVVSDRIRENFRIVRRATPEEIIDKSLNQTLGRTLMTSATTLLVLISLFFFGGDILHGFALALIIGVVIGTYSSIFVAASLLLTLKVTKEDLIVIKPETADDGMP